MIAEYSYDKELIKEFIRYISDQHKACIVQFPDEFAASAYVSYRFVNTVDLVNQFIEEK